MKENSFSRALFHKNYCYGNIDILAETIILNRNCAG